MVSLLIEYENQNISYNYHNNIIISLNHRFLLYKSISLAISLFRIESSIETNTYLNKQDSIVYPSMRMQNDNDNFKASNF